MTEREPQPDNYLGRFGSLEALVWSLPDEEREDCGRHMHYAATRDDHNWATDYSPEEQERRVTSILQEWVADRILTINVGNGMFDAYMRIED